MTARPVPPGELHGRHAEQGGLRGLAAAVRAGKIDAADLARASRARIAELDGRLHAFTQIFDPPLGDPAGGPLAGVPIALKDNIDIAGRITGLGRPLAERAPADRDAAVVAALRAAGAVIVGKTNLPELASSAVTRNAHFGDARNPADLTRTAGGSSGGSAAAVAADIVLAAIGTDTAGSVLMPAALTGCCGVRPTAGLLDTTGVAPLSPTLDTVGVFGRSPDDLAVVLDALGARPDQGPVLADLRIGVLGDLFREAEPAVLDAVDTALGRLRAAGARTVPVTLRSARAAARHGRTIYLDEVARAWAPVLAPDVVYAPTVEARRRTVADPDEAARARAFVPGWRAEVDAALGDVDVLAAPVTPVHAPRLPAGQADADLTRFTYPICLAGVPAVSVPCAELAQLPVGLLLVGRRGADRQLLAICDAIYSALHADPYLQEGPLP